MLQGGAILDLLVVGGGIHGVAVARDAAIRGLSVLLVERADLAGATSSRTSKLIHGGIRYLEHGEWHLVREALRERAVLLGIAPEHVRPLTFLLPVYRGEGRPRWMLDLGLSLYGLLAGRDPLAAHRRLDASAARAAEPGLRAERLAGGYLFHDAQMDDALLCVATAIAAERAGAAIRTYTEVRRLERAGTGWRARLADLERGVEEAVEARWVVNAAGPWADDVRALCRPGVDPVVRRTRGTHVVLEGALASHALLLTARRDGRVFFVLPWETHTVVGTTDVDESRDPGEVGPAADDVRYLLEEASRALPAARSARAVRAFAGVRPLAGTATRGGAPSANRREHRVLVEEGVVSVIGGKYTTHRSLAAAVVDRIVTADGRRASPSGTADSRLAVGREEGIAALARSHPRLLDLPGGLRLREAEVAFAVRVEKAKRLDDVLLRRTRLWLDGRALREAAGPASEWMAPLRGWDDRARRDQARRFLESLEDEARALQEAAP
ncbi:MAG TPA: glycerol-3-phosphate dehydrogenase/oxidase [Candidatus Eisenbacteria bacterium]|nr:glycerol-3-phosphate dehydrogenase/oxidase [Candidatus Eisenbacteria bacterium]